MKLEVKHDTHTYKIPIDIIYKCVTCMDTGTTVTQFHDPADFLEIPCPFCNTANETDDDT
jgi:hypothetical protein